MFLQFERHLRALVRDGSVATSVPLCDYSTMRVGGMADYFVEPASENDIAGVLRFASIEKIPLCLIGNGSNLLISDHGFRGIVLHLGKTWSRIDIHDAQITAQAGALLPAISKMAANACLTGLEFASGIPGSLGGAVCMNAGAYGGEMKDVITSVRVFVGDQILDLPAESLDFAYRHSAILANRWTVLSATLQLHPGEANLIKAAMDDYNTRRRTKQPLNYPSCGSFFKRPAGHYAGALIEQAGLKGLTVGGAQISDLHAGFVINTGTATAHDIYQLMLHVQKTVYEQFGVQLEPEVQMIGEF